MRKILENYTPRQADLLAMEDDLAQILKNFITFERMELYFPAKAARKVLTFLAEEALLLLPVKWRGEDLAMLRLRGVDAGELSALLPQLEKLIELALQRLVLERLADMDANSGLDTEASLFKHMERELDSVHTSLNGGKMPDASKLPLYRLCLGMIVIRWQEDQFVIRQHDHEFAELIYRSLAKKLAASLPEKVLAASLGIFEGRHDFALLFNAAGRDACFKLSHSVMANLEKEVFTDSLSGRKYSPSLYAGFALYPQDMAGEELILPFFEQTARFRNRASLAARMAKEWGGKALEDRIMSFAAIAGKSGRILEYTQKDKIRINLGRSANVREGMRFFVWGKQKEDGSEFLKGQITVLKSGHNESLAEISYLNKAEFTLQRGDRLTLPAPKAPIEDLDGADSMNQEIDSNIGQLLSHAAFLDLYAQKVSACPDFLVIILRYSRGEDGGLDPSEKIHSEFAALCKDSLPAGDSTLIGKYGADRIIIFMPSCPVNIGNELMEKLFNKVDNALACGIAPYPYLDYGRADTEDNALKALEYGELLPEPHIGVFDSMAITIAADKKYSLGDDFGAIDEYKRALLADASNALASNSLGVCMAALGKAAEAKKIWLDTLRIDMDDELRAKICYNLGAISQKAGDRKEASQWYRACLKNDKKHVFAWLRIGQLNEQRGRHGSAKRYYLCAANLSDADSDVFAVSQRYLARLELKDSDASQARSTLHQLLLKNPYDTASMNILAELYLGENGDPAISEMLARKSLQIKDSEQAWRVLAKSLLMAGKTAEAEQALLRAEKRASL